MQVGAGEREAKGQGQCEVLSSCSTGVMRVSLCRCQAITLVCMCKENHPLYIAVGINCKNAVNRVVHGRGPAYA